MNREFTIADARKAIRIARHFLKEGGRLLDALESCDDYTEHQLFKIARVCQMMSEPIEELIANFRKIAAEQN